MINFSKSIAVLTISIIFCIGVIIQAEARDGYDGRSGFSGISGQSQTLFADGTARNLNLSGSDGGDGTDAGNATRPYCSSSSHRPHNNIYLENGDDGGNGGRGGSGGNAGNFTVFFEDVAHLSTLLLDATPGKGGRPGRGGYGTEGCRCHYSSWTIRECRDRYRRDPRSDDPRDRWRDDRDCTSRTYYCRDGSRGRNGLTGSQGLSGSMGRVTLIPQKEALSAVVTSKNLDFSSLDGLSTRLTDHQWENRSGALSLFAPGSFISNNYRHYSGVLTVDIDFDWNATRPASDFSGRLLSAKLYGGVVDFDVPDDLWLDKNIIRTSSAKNQTIKFVINEALKGSDVMNIELAAVSGTKSEMIATIDDRSGVSDIVDTEFELSYQKTILGGFSSVWSGKISPQHLTYNGNAWEIAIGQLGIKPEYLKPGWFGAKRTVKVIISAIRSFKNKSNTKVFEKIYEIK